MSRLLSMADPAVAAIPVEECAEPLVDLRSIDELRLDTRQADPHGFYAHLREGVAARLLDAQRALPHGLRLLIIEGYRPLELQSRYFAEYSQQLRLANPSWPAAYVEQQASWHISPPEFAPHIAGAAVDLTLCTTDGEELPMGCPVNARPEESSATLHPAAELSSTLEAHHRGVLVTALTKAGLVNYPSEWWHWSFGDRYWACATAASVATYGPIGCGSVPASAGRT